MQTPSPAGEQPLHPTQSAPLCKHCHFLTIGERCCNPAVPRDLVDGTALPARQMRLLPSGAEGICGLSAKLYQRAADACNTCNGRRTILRKIRTAGQGATTKRVPCPDCASSDPARVG